MSVNTKQKYKSILAYLEKKTGVSLAGTPLAELSLNQQQLDAVQAVDGPVLLLAVPGSGKTTVLVTRLGFMVCCRGILPERILTLTYTVAATKDMASRFARLFDVVDPQLAGRLCFRTINGICSVIISDFARQTGRQVFDLVTDERVTGAILTQIYQQVYGEYPADSDLKSLRTTISYIKNMMLDEESIKRLEKDTFPELPKVWRMYCGEMRKKKLMDYDDQMIYAKRILEKFPQVLHALQERYPYICVDEAQDTSRIQHEIIRLLAGRRDNLFMVGDEDQSIYGFRAAYPQALLSFGDTHPGARILLMERNYRSGGKIVSAADRFISANKLRHQKHMNTENQFASSVRVIDLKARRAQYTYLLKVASECRRQTAVLFRDNESALPLVDLLERSAVAFTMRRTDLQFFSHRVVMDIRSFIGFSCNPKSTEHFMRIYYKMGLYLTRKQAEEACRRAAMKNMPVLDALLEMPGTDARTAKAIARASNTLRQIRRSTAADALHLIEYGLSYAQYLSNTDTSDSKLQILRMLAAQLPDDVPYSDTYSGTSSPDGVGSFPVLRLTDRLDYLQQVMEEMENRPDCPFILSTVHASKGLEYHTVYLIDVADGIFPQTVPDNLNQMGENEQRLYEEERRLFYVAITRAKAELCVFSYTKNAMFITQLKQACRENAVVAKPRQQVDAPPAQSAVRKSADDSGYRKYVSALAEGLLVTHTRYGEGVIISVGNDTVDILFGQKVRTFRISILYSRSLLQW